MAHQERAHNDLFWLAYLYVARELPEDEREAFENRLEHDLSACEAVAEAVHLQQRIARVAPPFSRSRSGANRPGRRVPPSLIRLSAAALLILFAGAVVLTVRGLRPGNTVESGFASAPSAWPGESPALERVVQTWARLHNPRQFTDEIEAGVSLVKDEVASAADLAPMEIDDDPDHSPASWVVELASLGDESLTTDPHVAREN